jgi:hypothetical protein
LAGGCPQPAASIYFVPDGFSRRPVGTRLQSGAKKLCSSELNATKLIGNYKAC